MHFDRFHFDCVAFAASLARTRAVLALVALALSLPLFVGCTGKSESRIPDMSTEALQIVTAASLTPTPAEPPAAELPPSIEDAPALEPLEDHEFAQPAPEEGASRETSPVAEPSLGELVFLHALPPAIRQQSEPAQILFANYAPAPSTSADSSDSAELPPTELPPQEPQEPEVCTPETCGMPGACSSSGCACASAGTCHRDSGACRSCGNGGACGACRDGRLFTPGEGRFMDRGPARRAVKFAAKGTFRVGRGAVRAVGAGLRCLFGCRRCR